MKAAQIAVARRGLGWTQAELAAEAGLHPKAVAYWERRGDANPHPLHANTGIYRIREALTRQGVTFGPDHVTINNP